MYKINDYELVILIGIITRNQNKDKSKEYLEELESLAKTAKAKVAKKFLQKINIYNKNTYLGSGKIKEIYTYLKKNYVDTIIFDDELSPTQINNLIKIFKIRIIDRTKLILDIFAKHARTFYARTQVELAQYQYLLPRLTRMWTHLERQRGGIGLRGPGETEIETDRRLLRNRINLLKNKLVNIDRQMSIQRKKRGLLVNISIVGYTNVGKSTLMNILSKSTVNVENQLFSTLYTTVRKIIINNFPLLLSDTVGFMSKLPTLLIESFKSTLDEVRYSDMLINVIDVTNTSIQEHIYSVNNILYELNAIKKPIIIVFNKIDKYDNSEIIEFKKKIIYEFEEIYSYSKNISNIIFLSAKKVKGIKHIKKLLYEKVKRIHTYIMNKSTKNIYSMYDTKGNIL
jgi:GTPase